MKIICVLLFVAACLLLYYGSTMLLFVPGYRGESYFAGRVIYGVLPAIGGIVLLITTGWLWARSCASISISKSIGRAFSFAIGAILLFWVGLIILADIRQS